MCSRGYCSPTQTDEASLYLNFNIRYNHAYLNGAYCGLFGLCYMIVYDQLCRGIKIFFLFLLLLFVFLLCRIGTNNFLSIANSSFFTYFQKDSEALVIGKLVIDKNKVEIQHQGLIRFLPVIGDQKESEIKFSGYGWVAYQYNFLEGLKVSQLSNKNWKFGFNVNSNILLLDRNDNIFNFVDDGIQFRINNQIRKVVNVELYNNYVLLSYDGGQLKPEQNAKIKLELNNNKLILDPYRSQVGLQGVFFSKLYNNLGFSLSSLYALTSFFLALTLVLLSVIYSKLFSYLFQISFLLSVILSPWIVSFARNLYWVEFTFFLPAIFVGQLVLTIKSKRKHWIWYLFIFLSILVKCLCGYEYISAIVLFASAPILILMITSANREKFIMWLKALIIVFTLSVLAFVVALIINANMISSGDIKSGLDVILTRAQERTFGTSSDIPMDRIDFNYLDVLGLYIFGWHTDVIKWIVSARAFMFFSVFPLAFITCEFVIKKNLNLFKKQIALYVSFALPALSWFFLAKGHSLVHTHMNYILWYMGFVATCIYFYLTKIVELCVLLYRNISKKVNYLR